MDRDMIAFAAGSACDTRPLGDALPALLSAVTNTDFRIYVVECEGSSTKVSPATLTVSATFVSGTAAAATGDEGPLSRSQPPRPLAKAPSPSGSSASLHLDSEDDSDEDGGIGESVVDHEEPDASPSPACALPQHGQVSRLRKTTRKFFWNVTRASLRAAISFPARIQVLLAEAKSSKRAAPS